MCNEIKEKAKKFIQDNISMKSFEIKTKTAYLPYKEQERLYLQILHGGNEGFICLPRKKKFKDEKEKKWIDENGKEHWKNPWENNNFWECGSQEDPLDLVWPLNDSYVSGNPMDGGENEKGKKIRNDHHCIGINEMHLDIDVLHAIDPYDTKLADQIISIIIKDLLSFLPEPTMIVSSGRGLTWIYRYKKMIPNPTKMEGKKIVHLNPEVIKHDSIYQELIKKIQKRYDPELIEIDSHVVDHARVLRHAGTMNTKAGRRAVILQFNNSAKYEPEELYGLLGVSVTNLSEKESKNITKKKTEKKRKSCRNCKSSNVIPFAPSEFRRAAKYRIEKMEQIPNHEILVDGTGRHKFTFVYYCHLRLRYTQEVAQKKVEELNVRFTEPLLKEELYRMMDAVDEHVEKKEWMVHGDGVYVFGTKSFITYLPLTEEKAREMGFLTSYENRKLYQKNQKEAEIRDKEVAELWLEGFSAEKISACLKEKYQHVSEKTVKRIIKKLGLTAERKTRIEEINFADCKRYARKKINRVNSTLNQKGREDEEIACEDLYREKILEEMLYGKDCNLLGGAGTGKSTLIKEFLEKTKRNVKVVAFTGSAACNIEGETIHSAFGIRILENYSNESVLFCSKLFELAKYDTIILDEVGMISSDLFSYIQRILREVERYFGKKIQVITSGDFQQLAPTSEDTRYAFESGDFHWQNGFILKKVYRQNDDQQFVEILNQVANGDSSSISYINQKAKIVKGYDELRKALEQGTIYLGSYRSDIKRINDMMVRGHVDDPSFKVIPAVGKEDHHLSVYEGMPVMFTKNKKKKGIANGTLGKIVKVRNKSVVVDVNGKLLNVKQESSWDQNGTKFLQLPLVPAYAITIHKSQGMTLDKVILNPRCFEAGQLYTGLSRVRSLQDLSLIKPIKEQDVIASKAVNEYKEFLNKREVTESIA